MQRRHLRPRLIHGRGTALIPVADRLRVELSARAQSGTILRASCDRHLSRLHKPVDEAIGLALDRGIEHLG